MRPEQDQFNLIIAGGGAVGLALACALADTLGSAFQIAVIDRLAFNAQTATRDARASAVSAGSKRLLSLLGLWPALEAHAQPVTGVDITDSALEDAFRPVLVSYDNTVEGREPATYIIENEVLHGVLLGAASRRSSISLKGGAEVAGYMAGEHRVELQLADGEVLRAPLLIAADGRRSRLRDAAGIAVVGWKYQQVSIVTTVKHQKPHRSRAVQHFLPTGPFAILPLVGNRSCVTWTEEEKRGNQIISLDNAAFAAETETRFGFRLGEVEPSGPRSLWPLEMHLARALVADRLALIGDAAHLVHPIAGQGLNLGLRDVAALAEVLADAARLGLDIGSSIVLSRYERWRRTDAALSAAAFDGLNRLFSNDWPLLRSVRGVGLGVVERLPLLKQFFVAEAAGLTGDVPKLLRGERV